ncbi:MAG: sigma-70 family RNA polymerase sigma factor [Planctomycetota bacterium]
MALSEIDRQLLERCLSNKPQAWQDFVDRFMGLVTLVVNHTAECRSIRLDRADKEDLVSEVFLAVIKNDYAVLRRFRGQSSLATYLTVIARRVVVSHLMKNISARFTTSEAAAEPLSPAASVEDRLGDTEQLHSLLTKLNGPEADVVRLYHLEGKSYQEISDQTGMPAGSIGPTLSRARARMRGGH